MEKTKKLRSAQRGALTKRIKEIEILLTQESRDDVERDVSLQTFCSYLQEKSDKLCDLNEEILNHLIDNNLDIDKELEVTEEFSLNLTRLRLRLEKALSNKASVDGSARARSNNQAGIRLPKLELRKFNGNFQDWNAWWDSFESAIHTNNSISMVDKFNYLRTLVTDIAYNSISGFRCTAENYAHAIHTLRSRFGKKNVLVSSHMNALMKLPDLKNCSDTKRLRSFFDQIELNVRSLEALGVSTSSYESILVMTLKEKLPEDVKLVINRRVCNDDELTTLRQLMDDIRLEIEARERGSFYSKKEVMFNIDQIVKKGQGATIGSLLASTESVCIFCQGKHSPSYCRLVTNIEARREHIKQDRRCFICLRKGHMAKRCRSNEKCSKCSKSHHDSICQADAIVNLERKPQITKRNSTSLFVDSSSTVLLQTGQAIVSKPGEQDRAIRARVIFDTGSQRSYIRKTLSDTLGLNPICTDVFKLNTFGNKGTLKECDLVQFKLNGIDTNESVVITAYSNPMICPPIENQRLDLDKFNFPHLQGLNLADESEEYDPTDIDILIGLDYYWTLMSNKVKRSLYGPVATYSKLGWILSGPVSNEVNTLDSQTQLLSMSKKVVSKGLNLEGQLERFWNLESLGINIEEESVYDKFGESIRFNGTRYVVELPWREQRVIIADNYKNSLNRLMSLFNRLSQKEEVMREYDSIMKEQLELGILEPVTDQKNQVGGVYYMPHHAVIKSEKTSTKVRVVYDASSSVVGPSLNQSVYQGPCLLPKIFHVLVKFRWHKIGIVAVIEKAFLNIEISENDRDYLRVLWFKDVYSQNPEILIYRFTRVVFGVACSPFHLNATLEYMLSVKDSNIRKTVEELKGKLNLSRRDILNTLLNIKESLYVDDLNSGGEDVESCYKLFKIALAITKAGGFNLRKWASNSPELMSRINNHNVNTVNDSSKTYAKSSLQVIDDCNDSSQKVLGMTWNKKQDTFEFSFAHQLSLFESVVSKRGLLSVVASFYDPLGLISPVILLLKVMFQKLCQEKGGWDKPLESKMIEQVTNIFHDMKNCEKITFPRCYSRVNKVRGIELHMFSDASELAFGAVIYMRVSCDDGIYISLVAAKSRIAPLKKQSIPRLELLAALTGVRLLLSVHSTLSKVIEFQKIYCWSDSKTVLYWIKGREKVWKQFVENRLIEIRKGTSPDQWRHVKGVENPADICSRGIPSTQLNSSKLWREGPYWLKKDISSWNLESIESKTSSTKECFDEMKIEFKRVSDIKNQNVEFETVNLLTSSSFTANLDYTNFSSKSRLMVVTGYVMRFIYNVKAKWITRKYQNNLNMKHGKLDAND